MYLDYVKSEGELPRSTRSSSRPRPVKDLQRPKYATAVYFRFAGNHATWYMVVEIQLLRWYGLHMHVHISGSFEVLLK